MVANRTREIRPSGMKRGAWGNVAYGGTVNPPRNRKGGAANPPPKGRRAPVLSQPSDSKLTGGARVVFPVDLAAVIPIHYLPLFQRRNRNDISVCCFGFKVTWTEEQSLRCLHGSVWHLERTPSFLSGWSPHGQAVRVTALRLEMPKPWNSTWHPFCSCFVQS